MSNKNYLSEKYITEINNLLNNKKNEAIYHIDDKINNLSFGAKGVNNNGNIEITEVLNKEDYINLEKKKKKMNKPPKNINNGLNIDLDKKKKYKQTKSKMGGNNINNNQPSVVENNNINDVTKLFIELLQNQNQIKK